MTLYFRRANGPRIRLLDYDHPNFWETYEAVSQESYVIDPPRIPLKERGGRHQQAAVQRALERGIKRAKKRSKESGRPCDLTLEWAVDTARSQQFRCALSGILFYAKHTSQLKRDPFMPSIDRIDCSKGYTQDNCRLVLLAVNLMLMDWGIEIFERVINQYRAHKGMKSKRKSARLRKSAAPPKNNKNEINELGGNKSGVEFPSGLEVA